jgi:hypothetical protein
MIGECRRPLATNKINAKAMIVSDTIMAHPKTLGCAMSTTTNLYEQESKYQLALLTTETEYTLHHSAYLVSVPDP